MKRKKGKTSRAASLKKRMDHSYKTKDSGMSSGILNLTSDVKFFKPKDGRNKIVILPFEIKSKNNPLVKNGDAEIGEWDYCLDVWVHRRIGPSKQDIVCLQRNYGKKCPICERMEEYKKDGETEDYDAIKPSRRVFYNVLNCKSMDAGVQVFGVSHFLFEKELIEEVRAISEDDEPINFSDPEDGWAIKFRAAQTSLGKSEFFEFKSFDFVNLDDELDDELLEEVISFDEIMTVLSYTEIESVLEGADDDDEEDDDDDDDDEDDEPKKKTRTRKAKKDNEPKKTTRKRKAKKDECPFGHEFGKDTDDFKDCDKCDLWEDCDSK
jgi:hypothetical protein